MRAARPENDNAPVESPPPKAWILLPREHGAYAELIFPLITALALGNGGIAPILLASAAIAVFLAHESFLVILGQRGNRARAQIGSRASLSVAFVVVITVTAATVGLWHAPADTLQTALLPLISIALLLPLIFSQREKTLVGELLVALIFASTLIPVARSGNVEIKTAAVASGVWLAIFTLQTLSVRAVKAHIKTEGETNFLPLVLVTLSLAVLIAGLLLVRTQDPMILPLAAVSPAAIVGIFCVWLRVHPRHLRTLGWVLVGCDLIALALVTASSG